MPKKKSWKIPQVVLPRKKNVRKKSFKEVPQVYNQKRKTCQKKKKKKVAFKKKQVPKKKSFKSYFTPYYQHWSPVSWFHPKTCRHGDFLNNLKSGMKLGQSETKYETGEDFTDNFSRKIFGILEIWRLWCIFLTKIRLTQTHLTKM